MATTQIESKATVTIAGRSTGVSADLQQDIEQFLYYEAELLDERRYRVWYELLAQDIHYWMPTRYNRTTRELDQEIAGPDMLAHFDENKQSLGWRLAQLESGMHWSEDPPSRTRHLVSNVRIRPGEQPGHYLVRSNFLCYRNRPDGEVNIWAGQREDVLRRTDGDYEIARRTILLDQDVVLSKNLSVFL